MAPPRLALSQLESEPPSRLRPGTPPSVRCAVFSRHLLGGFRLRPSEQCCVDIGDKHRAESLLPTFRAVHLEMELLHRVGIPFSCVKSHQTVSCGGHPVTSCRQPTRVPIFSCPHQRLSFSFFFFFDNNCFFGYEVVSHCGLNSHFSSD